jgi:hypothetical protein
MRPAVALGFAFAVLAFAPGASAYSFDPPPWWNDGKALVKARGGSCESSSHQAGEGYTEQAVDCKHFVPSAVVKELGGNPAYPREGCNGGAQSGGNEKFNDYAYLCGLYANPGTQANPNRASWRCERRKFETGALGGGRHEDDANWGAAKTKVFAARKASTLDGCLAPRARLFDAKQSLADARSKGVKLAVTCSHACKVKAGNVKTTLKAGRKTVLRVALKARLPVRVTAGKFSKSTSVKTRANGSKLKLSTPDTLLLKS